VKVHQAAATADTASLAVAAQNDRAAGDSRLWTDDTGNFQVTARFVAMHQGQVQLKNAAGQLLVVPIYRLSLGDIAFVRDQPPSQTSTTEKMRLDDRL
jgi:hypothetical protein